MNKLKIIIDKTNEMIKIENTSNGKQEFFGNYWDFNVPEDLIKMLRILDFYNVEVVENVISV